MAARLRPGSRGQREIAFFARTAVAGALFLLSSTSIAFQDVASLVVGDAPPARWQVRLVDGDVPGQRLAIDAAGQTYAVRAVIDPVQTGALPARGPVAINRDSKSDLLDPARPRFSIAAALAPAPSGASAGFAVDRPLMPTLLAFATPIAPEPVPAASNDPAEIAIAATSTSAQPGPTLARAATLATRAPAAPHLATTAGEPVQLAALNAAEPLLQGYAAEPTLDAVNAPFRAMLEVPTIQIAIPRPRPADLVPTVPTGIGDHPWATNPIPATARSAAELKCMAEAVYFEARGEPVGGQRAVAQVVINRLKNPAYPGTICGVVYQNRNMRNRCQFSFACDGIRDIVRDRGAWEIAERIARESLFSQQRWMTEVGSATHYHATYVRPRWARQMIRMTQIGHHIFYKTRGGGWI